ncbi:hypothetical protein MATL_G00040130 [Megalops atlanticus]|uniref:Ig-like domain-containing protein n=1 Tax=Megalops atlanticus TaxID=7932 RepID=A0A9D3QE35_MEGAT|nr:hypothetical protein MATL_G00040130 [Megalops atlanticus]
MCMCACVKNLCVKDFSVRCQLKRRVRMVSLQAACALYTVLFSTFTEAVKIIRAASGSFVHLPCPLAYNDSDTVVVNWTKVGSSNTLCSYRVERGALSNISSCKPHVNLTGHPPELYLTKLKISDAGIYNCKMSKVIPPPTEETFITLQLHVEDSPGVYIKKVESNQSDCQWLLCQLERLDPAEVNFTWSREGQRIPSGSSAGSLHLCKSDWNEGDTFTCTVSFNNTHFINSITLNGTNGGMHYPNSFFRSELMRSDCLFGLIDSHSLPRDAHRYGPCFRVLQAEPCPADSSLCGCVGWNSTPHLCSHLYL